MRNKVEEHIIIPTYSFMQDVVGTAIISEEQRLIKIIQNPYYGTAQISRKHD
ncbi:hypothetical protein [Bacillus cereus]|uniref:hypothetical protein n=1 Tax=Bacillus cereus TaxID=1396 RepID=UPI001596FFE9|nr:hypothetical protein [Bacillus cereus]